MYSTISSKKYIIKRELEKTSDISKIFLLFSQNNRLRGLRLEIFHVSSSAARGNQGVRGRVLQQPLASMSLTIETNFSLKIPGLIRQGSTLEELRVTTIRLKK